MRFSITLFNRALPEAAALKISVSDALCTYGGFRSFGEDHVDLRRRMSANKQKDPHVDRPFHYCHRPRSGRVLSRMGRHDRPRVRDRRVGAQCLNRSVEIYAVGDAAAMKQFVAELRNGSPASRVEAVEATAAEIQDVSGFMRRTTG